MKNTLIAIVIGLMFTATTASALALYNIVPTDNFTKITNTLIDNDGVTVYKFTDGKVTCYGSYTKQVQYAGQGVSISCIK